MSYPLPRLFGREVRRLHCVGVSGMGLGPLAIYLAGLGFIVSGEDDSLSDAMRIHLERARVRIGPMATDCELLVCSSAIPATHLTTVTATQLSIPIARRGELLAEIVRGRRLIAICGAHGKTTTTAMLITALRMAQMPFGYVLGGLFNDDSVAPAAAGKGEWVVAEIDESDGTIGCFSPEITLATNLDWDHPDYYRTAEELADTFKALFARTRGNVLVNQSCQDSVRMAEDSGKGLVVGLTGDFKYNLISDTDEGIVISLDGRFGISQATVCARGTFNAANAAMALAAAQLMGSALSPGLLASYPSVRRRQGLLYSDSALTVIEDYAHHPSEIRSLLQSMRAQLLGSERLVVAFQPHRFSRTLQFKAEFVTALMLANEVHLLDVYSAGESPITGGTSKDLQLAFPLDWLKSVFFHGSDAVECFASLEANLKPGDRVVVVGAGDIDQRAREWLAKRRWDGCLSRIVSKITADTKLSRDEPLAPKTTIQTGGAARLYAEPASDQDLRALIREARGEGIPHFLIGRGSNILVPDDGVDGLVLSLTHPIWSSFDQQADGRLWVGAGMRLKNLCGLASKEGLRGFEFLEGIPGSVGGALRMNAGAMGSWIFDVVSEVQVLLPDGEIKMLVRDQMDVSYRGCKILENAVALGAFFRPVSRAATNEISCQIHEYRQKRQETQPREPSAGCIFKNPEGGSAGRLIDECGLKGEREGDAEVSRVHANFIVNTGSATTSDILALIRRVRFRVQELKGVLLEPEVILFGKDWHSVL